MSKKIVTYMLGFLLFIAMFGFLVLMILSNTILNKQYILSILEKSDYFENIYYNIKDEFENYTVQSGVDEKDLEGIYTKEQVKTDIINLIDAIYENKEISLNSAIIAEKVDNKINEILQENNRKPEESEKEAIKKFEDTLANVYEQNIVYAKDYIEKLKELVTKVKNLIEKAIIAIIVINIVLILLISIINRNIKETVKTIGTALIATGILEILIKLLLENRIQNILVLNKAFSNSIIMLINSVIDTFFVAGIVTILIGLMSIIVCNIEKNKLSNL